MTTHALLTIAFPLVLCAIMFGLGLSLETKDFLAIKRQPKALLVGLFIQLIIGPILAFTFASAFSLPPELAVGLMLLSAAPGGPTSNIYSLLARGDLALNLSLTIVNSILAIVHLPIVLYLSIQFFMGAQSEMIVPYSKITQTLLVVLFPVVLGMLLRRKNVQFAIKLDPWIKGLSIAFILILIVVGINNEYNTLISIGLKLALVIMLFNLSTLTIAFFASRAFALERRQAIAITFEVGLHNCILAMTIAVSPHLLNNTTIALPAVGYSLFMLLSGAVVAKTFARTSS